MTQLLEDMAFFETFWRVVSEIRRRRSADCLEILASIKSRILSEQNLHVYFETIHSENKTENYSVTMWHTAIYEAPWKDEQIGAKNLSWKGCEKMGGVVN